MFPSTRCSRNSRRLIPLVLQKPKVNHCLWKVEEPWSLSRIQFAYTMGLRFAYRMGLLWKDDVPMLPYNRVQAEARLQYLKRRFHCDPELKWNTELWLRTVWLKVTLKGWAMQILRACFTRPVWRQVILKLWGTRGGLLVLKTDLKTKKCWSISWCQVVSLLC